MASIAAFFFEGSIRKWLIEVDSPYFYPVAFSKEMLAFLGLALSPGAMNLPSLKRYNRYLLKTPIFLSCCGCVIGMINDINVLGASITLRSMIVLPVAASLIGGIMSFSAVRPALAMIAFGVFVNAPLSVVQFNSPANDKINCYVGGMNVGVATTGFSDNVRATGTFSYISGLGFGALLGVAAGLAILMFARKNWEILLGGLVIVCGSVMALATVSRGPLLGCCVLILVAAAKSSRVRMLLAIVGLLAAFFGHLFPANMFGGVLEASFIRAGVANDSATGRIISPVSDLLGQVVETPFGAGLGLGQGATRRYGTVAVVESELARIVYETGIIGFLGFISVYGGAVIQLFAMARRTRQIKLRGALFVAMSLCCGILYTGVIFNHISSMVFWGAFAVGCLLFDMQRLPSSRRWAPEK